MSWRGDPLTSLCYRRLGCRGQAPNHILPLGVCSTLSDSRGLSTGHGFGGVAIIMSSRMHKLWDRRLQPFGERILAVRFRLNWGKYLTVACGYAPHSGYPALDREAFRTALMACEAATPRNDLFLFRADINCEPGNSASAKYISGTVGNYGDPAQNANGVQFSSALSASGLCLIPTFFRKRRRYTWFDHFNGPGGGRGHAIDTWITRTKDLRSVSDCGPKSAIATSDHRSMQLVLRSSAVPKRRAINTAAFGDLRSLIQQQVAENYICDFVSELDKSTTSSKLTPYEKLVRAASVAKALALPRKHLSQSWYEHSKPTLLKAIAARDVALGRYEKNRTQSTHRAFRKARSRLKKLNLRRKPIGWRLRWIRSTKLTCAPLGRPGDPSRIYELASASPLGLQYH